MMGRQAIIESSRKCQRCESTRILECSAKGDDRQSYGLGDSEQTGYAPYIDDICGGDYLQPDICLNCGQVQGTFPKPLTEMEEEE